MPPPASAPKSSRRQLSVMPSYSITIAVPNLITGSTFSIYGNYHQAFLKTMINFRKLVNLCLMASLSLCWMPAQAADTEWNIDQLMQLLSQTRSAQATFVETKSIAMLDAPVESSGELFYRAPDYFEKRTLKPKPESMVLDGNKIGRAHV